MAVREIIELGIKGADLVFRHLNKIQAEKKKLEKPSTVNLTSPASGQSGASLASNSPAPQAPVTPQPQNEEKSDAGKEASRNWQTAASNAVSTASAAASQDTRGLILGVGHALDVWTVGISGILAEMAGAAISFKDRVKTAAVEWADTTSARQTARNYARDAEFLRKGDRTTFRNRQDITTGEQQQIISMLGRQYGRLSDDFKDAIRNLYGTRDRPHDIGQASEIASGNFTALGNDRGFFMQKISDQLQNLPPSVRQRLMGQLFQQIPENELFSQGDENYKVRTDLNKFDNMERDRSRAMVTSGGNMAAALNIQKIQNDIDTGLAKAVGSLTEALQKAARMIEQESSRENVRRDATPARSLF